VWSISSCSSAALTAALIVAAGRVGMAVERKPLPAFTLTAADGAAVTSDRLVQSATWALIYVTPQCAPCQAVLRSLDRPGTSAPHRRLVIVVAADAEGLRAEAGRYANLSDATWLADPSHAMLQLFEQPGAPVIFGVRARMIEWSLAGVLMDATDAESIVVAWLSSPPD
jgi:hypothetical protein